MLGDWVTTRQAADELGISVRHFWRIVEEKTSIRRLPLNPRNTLWNIKDIRKTKKERAKNGY
jgi:predicted DNA-binding transcriptional regulator AlpA